MPPVNKGRKSSTKASKKSADRKIVHPKLAVAFLLREEGNALTAEQARELLGWRKTAESKEAQFTDIAGELIACDHNLDNREFDTKKSLSYAQDILSRAWSDSGNSSPDDAEPMSINGQTIVVNRYGELEDGQKRLAALVFASQIWNGEGELGKAQSTHWKEVWPEEPTMEALIVYGTSPSHRVRRTLDNTQTRDLQDVLFTGGYFGDKDVKNRSALTRTLAVSLQFLWHRVWGNMDAFHPSLTHSAIMDLLERHGGKRGKLVQAVEHIANENTIPTDRNGNAIPQAKRKISRYIASGTAAGLLYLMGCAATEPDEYFNAEAPSDKDLDWSLWERALEFWTALAKGGANFKEVRMAFDGLIDPETGTVGGSVAERLAILTLAWKRWSENHSIREQDVTLTDEMYRIEKDEEGKTVSKKLVVHPSIGGIDTARESKEEPGESTPPTPDELPDGPNGGVLTNGDDPEEEKKAREELENGKAPKKGKKADKDDGPTVAEQFQALKDQHPDKVILFKLPGKYRAYQSDAKTIKDVLGVKLVSVPNESETKYAEFPAKNLAGNLAKLLKEGHKVAISEQVEGSPVVTDYTPPE